MGDPQMTQMDADDMDFVDGTEGLTTNSTNGHEFLWV